MKLVQYNEYLVSTVDTDGLLTSKPTLLSTNTHEFPII